MRNSPRKEDLLQRAAAAVKGAMTAVARARLVSDAGRSTRDRTMTARCAWCGDFRLGGEWLNASDVPSWTLWSRHVGQTHSICPSCATTLKSDCKSH